MRSSLVRMRSSLVRMRSSLVRIRSSLVRIRSSLVVRASDCQCTSCNGHGFDPSIRRHSGIWGAADEAVLNIVGKKFPPKIWTQKKFLPLWLHRFSTTLVFLFDADTVHTYTDRADRTNFMSIITCSHPLGTSNEASLCGPWMKYYFMYRSIFYVPFMLLNRASAVKLLNSTEGVVWALKLLISVWRKPRGGE